jgi:hypothetical protein
MQRDLFRFWNGSFRMTRRSTEKKGGYVDLENFGRWTDVENQRCKELDIKVSIYKEGDEEFYKVKANTVKGSSA